MLLKRKHNEDGFTLLEVLVAVTVAGSVFVVLLSAFGVNLKSTGMAEGYTKASFLVRERMALLESKNKVSPGKEVGGFGDDYPEYRWETEIEKHVSLPFYIAKVVVFFEKGGVEREIEVETVLLDSA